MRTEEHRAHRGGRVGERHQIERAVDVDVKRSDGGGGRGRGAGAVVPVPVVLPVVVSFVVPKSASFVPALLVASLAPVTNAPPAVLEPPSTFPIPPTGTRSDAWMPIPLSGLSSSSGTCWVVPLPST